MLTFEFIHKSFTRYIICAPQNQVNEAYQVIEIIQNSKWVVFEEERSLVPYCSTIHLTPTITIVIVTSYWSEYREFLDWCVTYQIG